jgi:prephenate dehydrogenase
MSRTGGAIGGALSVIGTGLIGGSILRRLHSLDADVIGWDPDPATRDLGRDAGLRFADRLEAAVERRNLVFLCGPLRTLPDTLARVAELTSDDCVITDVGSTKSSVAAAARRLPRVVPGHPMAGTENAGLEAAVPTLFCGAPWVLCPEPTVSLPHYRRLAALIADAFEARVAPMPADRHDDVVALSSHIPHLLAGALTGAVARSAVRDGVLALAAGSFRDGTRVAGAPSWRTAAMVGENRAAVLSQMRLVQDALGTLVESLERDDNGALMSDFETGRHVRTDLLSRDMTPVERTFDRHAESAGERAFLVDTGVRGGYLTSCAVERDVVVYHALLPGG